MSRGKWIWIGILGSAIVTALIVAAALQHWTAIRRDSIAAVYNPMVYDADRGGAVILSAANALGEPRAVLIEHYPPITTDAISRARPQVEIRTTSSPDPEKSGVWVDGVRLDLKRGLNVFYFSEKLALTEIDIPEEHWPEFTEDAKGSAKPFDVIEKWILPRLPK